MWPSRDCCSMIWKITHSSSFLNFRIDPYSCSCILYFVVIYFAVPRKLNESMLYLVEPSYQCNNNFVSDLQTFMKLTLCSHHNILFFSKNIWGGYETIKPMPNNVTLWLKYVQNSKIIAMYFQELNLYLMTQESGILGCLIWN